MRAVGFTVLGKMLGAVGGVRGMFFAMLGLVLGALIGAVVGFLIGMGVAMALRVSCFDGSCADVAVAIGVLGCISCAIGGFVAGVSLGRRQSRSA